MVDSTNQYEYPQIQLLPRHNDTFSVASLHRTVNLGNRCNPEEDSQYMIHVESDGASVLSSSSPQFGSTRSPTGSFASLQGRDHGSCHGGGAGGVGTGKDVSFFGGGSAKDGSSVGGGSSSAGGASEIGLGVSFSGELSSRDRMFSNAPQHSGNMTMGGIGGMSGMGGLDRDRVDRVLEVTSFPTAMSYATSEAAKSDIATVCSGSVAEDIDSVMSGDIGTNQSGQPMTPSSQVSVGRKKHHERDVQFAGETSTMLTHNIYPIHRVSQTSIPFFQQQVQLLRSSPPGSTNSLINDMGPPLSRSLLLERAGGVANGLNCSGMPSRTGSVRSFGSQAPSDLVHVDTDDCGGSLIESEGRSSAMEENHSVQHNYSETAENSSEYGQCEEKPHDYSKSFGSDECAKDSMNEDSVPKNDELLRDRLSGPHSHGRTSPGGTVYKGKGVRRYRGRYFDLPLKRFHHNVVTVAPPHENVCTDGIVGEIGGTVTLANEIANGSLLSKHTGHGEFSGFHHRRDNWSRRQSCSQSRSRSRSRERSDDRCRRKWTRGKSRSNSPPSRHYHNWNQTISREDRDREFRGKNWKIGNGGSRWKGNYRGWNGYNSSVGNGNNGRQVASSSWHRNNNFRRWGHYRGRQKSRSPSHEKMTPRDSRHHRDRRRR